MVGSTNQKKPIYEKLIYTAIIMKQFLLSLSLSIIIFSQSFAQTTLDYYLPPGITYNSSIPTPQQTLGYHVGEWHVRHDQLLQYMYTLAEASDRITIHEYAKTYEQRQLVYLTITSADNHKNIEKLRQEHLLLRDQPKSEELDLTDMPAVVQLGYSVHGDEPSGANASMVVAYHLAAAKGDDIEELLDDTIILLDPSFNPDGLARFAHWANMHKGKTAVASSLHREHNEGFPTGRTNHYWFDLNRDWLLVQHPESQGRISYFHKWLPNVLTDHHEMGTNSTFFFQPGIPSRTHPLTPQRNQDLTGQIATYHERAFNKQQQLYYSQETFDDFYYGKGSTYPDINGSIGILFEQASSRGHVQESIHGILRFPETIENQVTVSLSTLEAVKDMKSQLLQYQREFFVDAAEEADESDIKGYIFGSNEDAARSHEMAKLLNQHQIQLHEIGRDITINGQIFEKNSAFVVPTNQKQYRLIEAMFETRTSFEDSLFYDVSTFTIPYAFNVPYETMDEKQLDDGLIGPEVDQLNLPVRNLIGGKSDYAYLFEWDGYYAPRALNRLHSIGVKAKVASKPFEISTARGVRSFDYGTIMIALDNQQVSENEIYEVMRQIAVKDAITVYAVSTGLTPQGIDLGSRSFENLEPVKAAIVVGEGVSSYEAGEAWHLLDQRYHMAPVLLDKQALARRDISTFTDIVMVNGRYSDLTNQTVDKLKHWIDDGGTLVAIKSAVRWAKSNGLLKVDYKTTDKESESESNVDVEAKANIRSQNRPYSKLSEDRGAQFIGGTIFQNTLDLTHPIGYGFNRQEIPVFRNSRLFLEPGENKYSTPLRYTDSPLLSGYVSDENLEILQHSAGIVVGGLGQGRIIAMADNPNFRAFWYGTNKLFANALFFGQTISGSAVN